MTITMDKLELLSKHIIDGASIHQAIELTIGWHPLEKRECPITVEEYKELVLEGLKHLD